MKIMNYQPAALFFQLLILIIIVYFREKLYQYSITVALTTILQLSPIEFEFCRLRLQSQTLVTKPKSHTY